MLPLRPFTASLQHLPSLANPMITGAEHQVNKEKLIWIAKKLLGAYSQ
jgi:hypothetical protein